MPGGQDVGVRAGVGTGKSPPRWGKHRRQIACGKFLVGAIRVFRAHHTTGWAARGVDNNRRGEGVALGSLANAYRDSGRIEESERAYQQALAIHRQIGHKRFEGIHLCDYALLRLDRGRLRQARNDWRSGARILRSVGDSFELQGKTNAMREACAKAGVPPFDEGDE